MSAQCIQPQKASLTSKKCENRLPALAQVHSSGEEQDLQRGIDGINAMVEQLSQRSTLTCPPRLASIHCIESLVQEQAYRPTRIDPRWAVLIERRRVP